MIVNVLEDETEQKTILRAKQDICSISDNFITKQAKKVSPGVNFTNILRAVTVEILYLHFHHHFARSYSGSFSTYILDLYFLAQVLAQKLLLKCW